MKYLLILLTITLKPALAQDSSATTNYVKLTTGKVLFGKAKLESSFGAQHILFKDSVKLPIAQVIEFQSDGSYYAKVDPHKLFDSGERFVQRTEHGSRIDVYSDFKTYWNHDQFGGGNWSNTVFEPLYFSKESNKLQSITLGNLKSALADNAASMAHLNQYQTLSVVKVVLMVGGLAVIGSSFSHVSKENPPNTTRLITGGIICNLVWIPQLMQGGLLDEAIRTYNQKKD